MASQAANDQFQELFLFKPAKIRKPEYWKFIKLIATNGDKSTWDSKSAIGAYCEQCRCKLVWSTKNFKQIERHMTKHHPNEMDTNVSMNKKPKLQPDKTIQLQGEAMLFKWLAESSRSFSIAQDPGFNLLASFLSTSQSSQFKIPSQDQLRQQLVQVEACVSLKIQSKMAIEVEYFSCTKDIVSVNESKKRYTALTVHYITHQFDRRKFTLDVASETDLNCLVKWGLCHSKMIHSRSENILQSFRIILDSICSHDTVRKFRTIENCLPDWKSTYEALQKMLSSESVEKSDISEQDWALLHGFTLLLELFDGTLRALMDDADLTLAFAVPILRRLRTHLENDNPISSFAQMYKDKAFFLAVVQELDSVRKELLGDFDKSLSMDILWITLLDPRCRDLKHLTEEERSNGREMLIDAAGKVNIERTAVELSESFALDILDAADQNPDQGVSEREAVVREVEKYLDTSIIVPMSINALAWWKINRYQYPRIASIARMWLSIPASCTEHNIVETPEWMTDDVLCDHIIFDRNINSSELTIQEIVTAFSANVK